MKLSKKDRRALSDAIDEAAWEICAKHISNVTERPPDDWAPEERDKFDLIHEVKYQLEAKLREHLPAPNDMPPVARFRRAVRELNEVLEVLRAGPHPMANYYVTDAGINLMKGESHDMRTMRPLFGNVIALESMPYTSGGDW